MSGDSFESRLDSLDELEATPAGTTTEIVVLRVAIEEFLRGTRGSDQVQADFHKLMFLLADNDSDALRERAEKAEAAAKDASFRAAKAALGQLGERQARVNAEAERDELQARFEDERDARIASQRLAELRERAAECDRNELRFAKRLAESVDEDHAKSSAPEREAPDGQVNWTPAGKIDLTEAARKALTDPDFQARMHATLIDRERMFADEAGKPDPFEGVDTATTVAQHVRARGDAIERAIVAERRRLWAQPLAARIIDAKLRSLAQLRRNLQPLDGDPEPIVTLHQDGELVACNISWEGEPVEDRRPFPGMRMETQERAPDDEDYNSGMKCGFPRIVSMQTMDARLDGMMNRIVAVEGNQAATRAAHGTRLTRLETQRPTIIAEELTRTLLEYRDRLDAFGSVLKCTANSTAVEHALLALTKRLDALDGGKPDLEFPLPERLRIMDGAFDRFTDKTIPAINERLKDFDEFCAFMNGFKGGADSRMESITKRLDAIDLAFVKLAGWKNRMAAELDELDERAPRLTDTMTRKDLDRAVEQLETDDGETGATCFGHARREPYFVQPMLTFDMDKACAICKSSFARLTNANTTSAEREAIRECMFACSCDATEPYDGPVGGAGAAP